jgi:uncharacterized protein (DUF2147 family)
MLHKLGCDGTRRNISPAERSCHCSHNRLSLWWPPLDSVRKLITKTQSVCCDAAHGPQNRPALHALSLAVALSLLPVRTMAADAGPTGEWLVGNKEARMRMVDCGGALWGVISWEKNPGPDSHNPDPAKRSRPMLGVPIVLGMKPDGPNKWTGSIYMSAWGKIFSGGVSLEKPDTLRINGCLLGFLCGGENWSRPTEPAVGKVLEQTDDAICKAVTAEH